MHGARWVYAVQDYLFKAEPKYVKKRVADLIDRSVRGYMRGKSVRFCTDTLILPWQAKDKPMLTRALRC